MLKERVWKIVVCFASTWTAACGLPVGEAEELEPTASTTEAVANNRVAGYVAYAPGADFNRCVPRAAGLLDRLNARGDLIGYHYSASNYVDLEEELWHAQGIARLPFYEWDWLFRGQFFVTDYSHPMGTRPDGDSHLGIIEMGFKGGKNGKALGTNRAYNENWNPGTWVPDPAFSAADWLVTPNPADRLIPVGGRTDFPIDPAQNHPGGLSTIGWHVVVPLQKFECGLFGCETPGNSEPWIQIYDLYWPDNPVARTRFLSMVRPVSDEGNSAASVAITKLADGRFLMAIDKDMPESVIDFYVSQGTDMDVADGLFGVNGRAPHAVYRPNLGYTGMNFITDCETGDLYLIGMKGDDFVFQHKVELFQSDPPWRSYRVEMSAATQKQMYCSDNADNDQCNFNAAVGTYIDPTGSVIIYATEYENDGAASGVNPYVYGNGMPWERSDPSHSRYVRGVEFRERHGALNSPTNCPTLADAWVEFYQNKNFNNYGRDPGHVYRIDYDARNERNRRRLDVNFFNDKATSVRWCIPVGHSFAFYRDFSETGSYAYLNGASHVRYSPDFTTYDTTYTHGGGATNDSISSFHFAENYVDQYGWVGWIDGTF